MYEWEASVPKDGLPCTRQPQMSIWPQPVIQWAWMTWLQCQSDLCHPATDHIQVQTILSHLLEIKHSNCYYKMYLFLFQLQIVDNDILNSIEWHTCNVWHRCISNVNSLPSKWCKILSGISSKTIASSCVNLMIICVSFSGTTMAIWEGPCWYLDWGTNRYDNT